MRLKFQDPEKNLTELFVNPEFTIETVKVMLCQKVQHLTPDCLVLIIRRQEVSIHVIKCFKSQDNH